MGWGVGCRGGSVRRFGRSVGSRSIMSRGWSISGWFLCSTMYVVLVVAGSNIFVEYGSVSTVETILLSISMTEVINLNTEKRSRSGYTRIFREYMNIPGYTLYIQVHPYTGYSLLYSGTSRHSKYIRIFREYPDI